MCVVVVAVAVVVVVVCVCVCVGGGGGGAFIAADIVNHRLIERLIFFLLVFLFLLSC